MHHLWRHLRYTKMEVDSFNSTVFDENDFPSFDSSSSSSSGGGGHGRDAYEFVAFLLWYLFLVLCCVIPTCCAYRRRRLVEARIAQQQASVNRIERQNLFILSSLRQSQQNTERIREQRSTKITEKLKETTMTVEERNIVDISGAENQTMPRNTVMIVDEPASNENDNNDVENPPNLAIEYDIEAENTHALQLTAEGSETVTRTVPGACAICLCPYEQGDKVSWSPREACQHAFHSECIIPWLAKSDEPKCPCCRQDFCDSVPVSQLEVDPISIFGPPTSFAGLVTAEDGDEDMVIPHFMRTLEASRLEFLASLELATVESGRRTITENSTGDQGGAPFDGSPFEGASEEAQVAGSGNSTNEEEEEGEPNNLSLEENVGTEERYVVAATAASAPAPVVDEYVVGEHTVTATASVDPDAEDSPRNSQSTPQPP